MNTKRIAPSANRFAITASKWIKIVSSLVGLVFLGPIMLVGFLIGMTSTNYATGDTNRAFWYTVNIAYIALSLGGFAGLCALCLGEFVPARYVMQNARVRLVIGLGLLCGIFAAGSIVFLSIQTAIEVNELRASDIGFASFLLALCVQAIHSLYKLCAAPKKLAAGRVDA